MTVALLLAAGGRDATAASTESLSYDLISFPIVSGQAATVGEPPVSLRMPEPILPVIRR